MHKRILTAALWFTLALFLLATRQMQRASAAPDSFGGAFVSGGAIMPGGFAEDPQTTPPLLPAVYSSPINGGCVQVMPSVCKLHLDLFTIQVAPDHTLQAFQLFANGSLIYDYRTDVSKRLSGNNPRSWQRAPLSCRCAASPARSPAA